MAEITFDTAAGLWSVDGDWIGNVKPGAADDATFDFSSGDCVLDENSAALGAFNASMYTGTLAIGAFDIDSNGAFAWLGGTFTGSPGSVISAAGDFILTSGMTFDTDIGIVLDAAVGAALTTNAVPIGPLTVAGSGNFVLNDALACRSIVLTSGVLHLNDYNVTMAAGSTLTASGGTMTSTTDYASTINAGGGVVEGVVSDKWVNVVNGVDGGGNVKLAGLIPLTAISGGYVGGRVVSRRR